MKLLTDGELEMSSIFLIYNENKLHSVASTVRHTTNMIKEKFDSQKLDSIRIEKYALNNMYNHSLEQTFNIDSNYQLRAINYA